MLNLDHLLQLTPKGFTAHTLEVGDHKIYYETAGKEDATNTFILSHGAAGTGRFMNVMAQKLIDTSERVKVIVLDLPYHGQSASVKEPKSKFSVHDYATIVSDLIDALYEAGEIQGNLNWIGWSMGGSIGMLLDLKGVEFNTLSLVNSSPVWDTVDGLIYTLPEFSDPDLLPVVFKSIVAENLNTNFSTQDQETVLKHYEDITPTGEVMVQDFAAIAGQHYNIVEQVKDLKAHVIVIGGETDVVATTQHHDILCENLSNGTHLMLPDNHVQLVKEQYVEEMVNTILTCSGSI